MNLLMISGDRSMLQGKQGAFWYTLQEFSKHWGRIDVICPKVDTLHSTLDTRVFFGNVHFHPSPWGLLKQPRWIVQKGHELITLYKHSVMTVHEYPPFYNGLGAKRLWKMLKIPYALEIHHIVGHPHPASFVERIGRWMSRAYLRHDAATAAGVRTVSRSVTAQLVQWGVPESKVRVVPSFYLDRQLLSSEHAASPHYDVVFCGRLVANKGLLETIRAVHALEKATLLIVGDGPQRSAAEALARSLGMSHRVEFRGWLPTQEDVIHALQSAKVFVMNSRSEGGPRVALEAMACGLPVISTRVGVMPDVIEDGVNGLFTTGTPEDLSHVLARTLEDAPMRQRLSHEARKILDQFERERLIARYAQYLQSLA